MPEQPSWVSLRSDDLTAEINPLGAQLSVLKERSGQDLLWDGDPAVWNGRAPLLFPIVGVVAGGRYRLGSKTYPLPRHGFARGKLFAVESSTPSSAVFRLDADDATFQVYPFHFQLTVHFELIGPTLTVTTLVRNRGGEDMPASVGYHPAFRWPLPSGASRSSHVIQFEADEPAPIRRINSDGLLISTRYPTPIVDRRLTLTDALFQDDVLIMDQIRSRSVLYGSDTGPKLRVGFPDAHYLGLWSKPGANFVCIEPWHGITDAEGFTGDFREKAGVLRVAAGTAFSTTLAITIVEAQ